MRRDAFGYPVIEMAYVTYGVENAATFASSSVRQWGHPDERREREAFLCSYLGTTDHCG